MKTLTFYERTILENIEGFGYYNINEPKDNFNKVLEVYKIFKSEYVHQNNKHLNEVHLFAEWLQGLPTILTVPFYNYEILKNAEKDGFNLMTEEAEDNFLEIYWHNLATAFFALKNNL